jgi:hypothetical protein
VSKLRKASVITFVLIALAVAPVAMAAPSNVVNIADYVAVRDCSADVTAAFQEGINAWRYGQLNDTAGELYIPAGCYQIDGTLHFRPPTGHPALYGNVRGDGPGRTEIHGRAGRTTILMRNFQGGEFGGMSFTGAPEAGNMNRDTNPNHAALVIGSLTDAMGTNRVHFHNLTCEHYSRCYVIGDYQTGGSAAELHFTNVGASQTHMCFHVLTYNTLDISWDQANVSECDAGFFVQQAYGLHWTNGASGNNYRTFYLASSGESSIRGWRDEKGPNTKYFIEYGGAAGDHHLIVESTAVVDAVNPHRTGQVAISKLTNASSLYLVGSTIHGSVDGKKITLFNNTFTDTVAFQSWAGQWRIIGNNCFGDPNHGQCTADILPQFTGIK